MLRLGPVTSVELVEFTVPGQRRVMPKASDWGASHLALFVDDIDLAAASLRERGVKVLEGPITNGPGPIEGSRYIYFMTPWGMPMELEQRSGALPYEGPGRHPYGPAPAWNWRPQGEAEGETTVNREPDGKLFAWRGPRRGSRPGRCDGPQDARNVRIPLAALGSLPPLVRRLWPLRRCRLRGVGGRGRARSPRRLWQLLERRPDRSVVHHPRTIQSNRKQVKKEAMAPSRLPPKTPLCPRGHLPRTCSSCAVQAPATAS